MNLSLFGKNALVCGASKGIGKAAAYELASLGANVTVVSRSRDLMLAMIGDMSKDFDKGQDHDWLYADFSDFEDLRKRILTIASKKQYHILINNSGGPRPGPIANASIKDFEDAFTKHLKCSHTLVQILKDGMMEANYGRIINIISTSVKTPLDNLGVSNTVRGAMANWSKTLANELSKHGITVNNVLPGFINTDRLNDIFTLRANELAIPVDDFRQKMEATVPMKRIGEPREIGAVIAFLASPAASYVNGANWAVDGGRTRSL